MSSPAGETHSDERLIEDEAGLFGSDSEDEQSIASHASRKNKRRRLDEPELDSGDDEGRHDRVGSNIEDDEEIAERTAVITDISIGTHPGPTPSDGELYILHFPSTISLDPKAFTLEGFKPPTARNDSSAPNSSTFSAYATSNNTIRWRQRPRHSFTVQSNARINRWSDGSLTLQLASNPREQFDLTAKALAQPQSNPVVPTPTSKLTARGDTAAYNSRLDSHTYLAAPHEGAGLMRNTHHVTISLAVQSSEQDDDALLKLQQGLAAAGKGSKATTDGGLEVISINEDPENAKRRAELAEKEKAKMQRRFQMQQERESNRANSVLKRAGLRTSGLTVGVLEGEEDSGAAKARKIRATKKRSRRRNDEYSDEDDYAGRRRTKEDEYDEDDGFLVGSDEEPEVGEESDEEEEDDLDADGDEDEDQPVRNDKPVKENEASNSVRHQGRRIVEDEDEDET